MQATGPHDILESHNNKQTGNMGGDAMFERPAARQCKVAVHQETERLWIPILTSQRCIDRADVLLHMGGYLVALD